MATLPEQVILLILSLSFLKEMLSAPIMVKLVAVFGISYTSYIWFCEYLQEMHIYLMAAWNARHLHQLSKTCRNMVGITHIERHYSWYERYLHCAGELWGVEMWRTYRQYTTPHYLFIYLTLLILAHSIIRQGGCMLKNFTDDQSSSVDVMESSDDLPPLPGAYHMYSSSYVSNLQAKTSSNIASLVGALEASRQHGKEACAGSLIFRVLQKAVLQKEVSKLKAELRAEKGKIWALRSPSSSCRTSPAASLLRPPVHDATLITNLQLELHAAKQETEDLKNEVVAAKTLRKRSVKFAAPTKSDFEQDGEGTAPPEELEAAQGEGKASKTAAASAAAITAQLDKQVSISHTAKQNLATANATIGQLEEQISTLKKAGRDVEATNKELIRHNRELADALVGYKSPIVEEVARRSAYYQREIRKLHDQNSREGRALQKELKSVQKDLRNAAQSRDDKERKVDAITAELANAHAISSKHEQTIASLEDRAKSLRMEIICAQEACRDAVTALEKAQVEHTIAEKRIRRLTQKGAEQSLQKMKMLNQSLESQLEGRRGALEAARETNRVAEERLRELETELEDQATEADLKVQEKEMIIDDLKTQADTDNMALFDKQVVRLDPAVLKAELDMANIEEELGRLRDKVSDLQNQLERKTKEAEDRQATDNDKIIEYMERYRDANAALGAESEELGELRKMVEEQEAVLSRLAGTDDLFED